MAATTIADLAHAPVELLLAAIQERQPRMNRIFNSPLVLQDPRNFANRALEDGAIVVELPIISPLTGTYTAKPWHTAHGHWHHLHPAESPGHVPGESLGA